MIDKNVGETNRVLRLGFGAIGVFSGVAVFTLLQQSFGGGLLIIAGLILLITAVLRRCPVTRALKLDIQSNDGL